MLKKIFLALSLLVICVSAEAESILSTAPAGSQSSMNRPSGFRRCDVIPGGFHHGYWQTTHLRCYKRQGVWETGYFLCSKVKHGSCRHWKWISPHWVLY